jgi:hypothetical protein
MVYLTILFKFQRLHSITWQNACEQFISKDVEGNQIGLFQRSIPKVIQRDLENKKKKNL